MNKPSAPIKSFFALVNYYSEKISQLEDDFSEIHKESWNEGYAAGVSDTLAKWPTQKEFEDYFFTPRLKGPIDVYAWLQERLKG